MSNNGVMVFWNSGWSALSHLSIERERFGVLPAKEKGYHILSLETRLYIPIGTFRLFSEKQLGGKNEMKIGLSY